MNFKHITEELKHHAPFTAMGALIGMILMGVVTFIGLSHETSRAIFHTLHPAHILLSAVVTTAMYRRYRRSIVAAVVIGFVGSVPICSISDIIFPYLGGCCSDFP